MRKIEELLTGNNAVWFYLGENEPLKSNFANELNEMGFTFLNGNPITKDSIGRVMSVHTDGKIAYVSLMVWSFAFKPGDGSYGPRHNFYETPKIDYEKYVYGDDSYIMTTCNCRRIS